jgi:hypothetical protein
MKYHLLIVFTICSFLSFSQEKYITRSGIVAFEASVPSFEEVKAVHESVTAIVNTKNGEFAALVLIKGFRFKNALMEEHFNENYAESDKYPKATFKGQIEGFDFKHIKGKSDYLINGVLTFHGKSFQLESVSSSILKKEDVIIITGSFKTLASNFDIKIPKIVSGKIAEDILVNFKYELKKK